MRQFVNVSVVLAVLCFILLGSTPLHGQEWSAAQKDVWKSVETYWALEAQGDLEGLMAYYHPDYRGWFYGSALPSDKVSTRKFIEYRLKTTKLLVYDIKPAAIQIHGSVAFVDYYYALVFKDAEGKEQNSRGRWTDILIKEGDKWVMIGDHGGQTSKD
jgi:ketosteroid isomerase-like protein